MNHDWVLITAAVLVFAALAYAVVREMRKGSITKVQAPTLIGAFIAFSTALQKHGIGEFMVMLTDAADEEAISRALPREWQGFWDRGLVLARTSYDVTKIDGVYVLVPSGHPAPEQGNPKEAMG